MGGMWPQGYLSIVYMEAAVSPRVSRNRRYSFLEKGLRIRPIYPWTYIANYYKVYKERRAQRVSNSDKELLQTIVLLPPSFY